MYTTYGNTPTPSLWCIINSIVVPLLNFKFTLHAQMSWDKQQDNATSMSMGPLHRILGADNRKNYSPLNSHHYS